MNNVLVDVLIKVRESETPEMETLASTGCVFSVKCGGLATTPGKVNCLLQVYLFIVVQCTSFSTIEPLISFEINNQIANQLELIKCSEFEPQD